MKLIPHLTSRFTACCPPALRVAAVVISCCAASAFGQATVSIRADYWYPYNGDPNDAAPGYVIEILRLVFEQDGGKLDYQIIPWKRAVAEADAGSINGVIGALKTDTPTYIFPDEPIGLSGNTYFVKKNSPFQYTGLESLKGKKLGVLSGYSYGEDLDAYIKQNAAAPQLINESSGDNPDEQAVRKLQAGRIDVYVGDRAVTLARIKKLGLAADIVEAGTMGEPEPIYVSFTPQKPESKALAEKLTQGIRTLRSSGELAKILQKYAAKDWVK